MAASTETVLTAVMDGLTLGGLYALVGVSFNVLYRPTNVFNFAQGELVMVGAMTGATAISVYEFPFAAAAALVFVAVGALALLEARVAVEPVLKRSARSHSWIITTLACSMIAVNAVNQIWSADPIRVAAPWPLSAKMFELPGLLRASPYGIAIVILASLVVLGVERAYRTRAGAAVLAVAEDREAALLRGVRPDRLARLSFFLGGGLAGVVGLLCAPIMFASTSLGAMLLFKGFAAAAIGGVGDNRGCLIAGFVLGVAEALGVLFLTPGYQLAVVFLVFLAVLMIRPQGLFGRVEERHV